ncbi:UvrD-helicase domain-containing protein [Zhongshania sp.]|jgi:DNA helicase-2/ATP-dependent DNA helicase PcrA|uniref:UvrD-helicase domain-containing protein n=1 Tax=Zhongshania sp. TaxID=1971902 RepID=UPI0039E5DD0B
MMANDLIIASAGSGKTTALVKKAIGKANAGETVLITTFTEACEAEIKNKLVENSNGYISDNITIQTWFSFLIKHGAKPYQDYVIDNEITGLILVSGKSGLRHETEGGKKFYWGEAKNLYEFYFSKSGKIYSDKLAKFVIRCNKDSGGKVIERLSQCFDNIFIDEVQDLAGFDLEILKYLFTCQSNILLVGDPRQATYSTNNAQKHSKFRKSEIVNFFSDDTINIDTDDKLLTVNHRCSPQICEYSNTLYPELPKSTSGNDTVTGHDGIIIIDKLNVDSYLEEYQPVQLRYSIKTPVNTDYPVYTFGKSKGLTFDRVLIYPTGPIFNWLVSSENGLKGISRAGFYVALTRARFSVGVVLESKQYNEIKGISVYRNRYYQK